MKKIKKELTVTSEDIQDLLFLQVKLRHRAIEICNAIHKEVLNEDYEFDPEMDKIEFILDTDFDVDEDGDVEVLEFPIPSVVIKAYSEEDSKYNIIMDYPITWLKDGVDYIECSREMKRLDKLFDDRFKEYYERLEEQVRREELSLNLKGDPNPMVNEEYHTDKYIEISAQIDKEINKLNKFKELPPSDFSEGLKEYIKDFKNGDLDGLGEETDDDEDDEPEDPRNPEID